MRAASSHKKAGQQGIDAFNANDYEKAIELLSQGLRGMPRELKWLITRCEAYMKVKPAQPEDALSDAERAYCAAFERKDRENMIQAMHFRATSLFRLGRLADSDRCCRWVLDLCYGHPVSKREDAEPRTDVDAQGRYQVPDFDPLGHAPFKTNYSRQATRIGFLRTQVISRIKALWAAGGDDPALKPLVKKMPDIELQDAGKDGAPRGESAEATDNNASHAGSEAVVEVHKADPVEELHSAILAKYHGDVNVWHRFYVETKALKDLDSGVEQELEAKNKTYWEKARPRCDHFHANGKVSLNIYIKGVHKHCAGSQDPCELQVQPQKVSTLGGGGGGGFIQLLFFLLFAAFTSSGESVRILNMPQLTLLNLPGYNTVGRAFSITLPEKVQPFLTAWRISSVKIEIVLQPVSVSWWKTLPIARTSYSHPASEVFETKAGENDAWM